jgi:predicted dinucleotide-binding enzyme
MKIGVLGTGMVGQAIASRLAALDHDVTMGARSASNEKAAEWASGHGGHAGSFADAAADADMVFNCTKGEAALDVLDQAGADSLAGKTLVDVSNPLDFSKGMPPSLSVCNTDSLAETIQRRFPSANVVKTLNTMNAEIMVDPARLPGHHAVFLCGNDQAAKDQVIDLLKTFGWRDILDLGDLTAARGMEMVLPIWLKLMQRLSTADFNFAITRAE